MKSYCDLIRRHYGESWKNDPTDSKLSVGRFEDLPPDFCVLQFAPTANRSMWTYATDCMSQPADKAKVELHIFAPAQEPAVVELLYATAHFHRTGRNLDIGHTVNFGRAWYPSSLCHRALISRPYLDGPELEWLNTPDGRIRFLWMIPVTDAEVEFKKIHGLDALEEKMERANFNYLDPYRNSVV